MSDHDTDRTDVDIDELRERVAALSEAAEALREYGDAHDIPAIERSAARVEGTVRVIESNVPGTGSRARDPADEGSDRADGE